MEENPLNTQARPCRLMLDSAPRENPYVYVECTAAPAQNKFHSETERGSQEQKGQKSAKGQEIKSVLSDTSYFLTLSVEQALH